MTQAKEAFATELLKLQNDETVRLRPLSIKRLKEFNRLLRQEIEPDDEGNVDGLGKILDLAVYCLVSVDPNFKDREEELEDVIDVDTAHEIIAVCGGVDLRIQVDDEDFRRLTRDQEDNGTTTS